MKVKFLSEYHEILGDLVTEYYFSSLCQQGRILLSGNCAGFLQPALHTENSFRFCTVKHHHWNFTTAQIILPLDNLLKRAVTSLSSIQWEILQAVLSVKSSFKKPAPVNLVCSRKNKISSDSNAFQLVVNILWLECTCLCVHNQMDVYENSITQNNIAVYSLWG